LILFSGYASHPCARVCSSFSSSSSILLLLLFFLQETLLLFLIIFCWHQMKWKQKEKKRDAHLMWF